jgi:hypothetical protein
MSQQAIASQNEEGANEDEPSLAPNDQWLNYDRTSYMPALGIYNHVERTDGSQDIEALDAGINCTQLILHAKTYTIGQIYVDGVTFDENNPSAATNSFYIVGNPDDVQGEGVHGDINLVIPGDIIRCETGTHWAIVQNISYNQNQTRITTGQLIDLIHSATFNARWFVQKGETLATFNFYTHVYLLRPKVE